MRKSLTEIANFYGTDKGTVGPSKKWNAHNYTDIYEPYLEKHRESKISFLEIGLGVTGDNWKADIVHGKNTGGASIKMWHEYFKNAKIYGIDINKCSYLDNDRITTFVADQGNTDDLEAFVQLTKVEEFDCIVDDGSHRPDHQQVSFSYFFKKLKIGGLYIIEDLLSNGMGDHITKGRMACDNVVNTRSVMKHFRSTGNFLEPNVLSDQDYLSEHIESINFHAPINSIKYGFRKNFFKPIKKMYSFRSDSERVCVIKKK